VSPTRLDGVESELAGVVDGVAERFVPEEMHGQLIEAEHLSRYWWASSLVSGKRVLDAGCGTAYGSAILARAGAREVVGVDVAADVLAAVKPRMPRRVRLERADVSSLPFTDDRFDVVVCFEVIEHVEDAEATLDEFARVLAQDGVLAISSPNRDVYVPGNPHHRHEFVPDELEDTLSRRFASVRLYRQADWVTAAVLDDRLHAFEGDELLDGVVLRKAVAGKLGAELYTLALATNGELPEPPPSATLTSAADIKAVVETSERLTDHYRKVEKERRELQRRTARTEREAGDARGEAAALGSRLLAVETELARARLTVSRQAGDLEAADARFREMEAAERRARDEVQTAERRARDELKEARRVIRAMQDTKVWRFGTTFWRLRDRLLRRS
jgi:SAM-dependent methyltransferase